MLIGAIDGGGTKMLAGVVDHTGRILAQQSEAVRINSPAAYFKRSGELLLMSVKQLGMRLDVLAGVGVSLPAMTDGEEHILGSPSSGWGTFPVRPMLASALSGIDSNSIFIENDVNACALAEQRFVAGGDNFVWLTISTGIGGAVVANNQLIRGAHSCAGEFGHLKVEYVDPRQCGCGGLGCLEAHASGTALSYMAMESGLGNIDARQIAQLARNGNPDADLLMARAGHYIGRGLAMIANTLNPACAYLGGGVAQSLDLLLPSLEATFRAEVLPQCQKISIRYTKLNYEAGLLGAAALCLNGLENKESYAKPE